MRTYAFLTMLVVLVNGCWERNLPEELEIDIRSLPSRLSQGNSEPYCRYLYERIAAQTNKTIRFASYALLWDTLYSARIKGDDSHISSWLINSIDTGLDEANYGLCKSGLLRKKAIENIVNRFRWMKLQGDRLQPVHRIDYNELNSEDRQKYDEWRGSYLLCRGYYENRLYMFEKYYWMKLITVGGEALTDEERNVLRVQTEKLLGRPLRTLEQLRAMRNVDSEEIKAVKCKEIGPACFARESDPPVPETDPPELTK